MSDSPDVLDAALALAVPFIAREEGCRLAPYRDAVGVPTIGYGHVIPSMDHPPITKDEATALLAVDARRFARGVLKLCPGLADEPPYRLAALTSFAFNLGLGNFGASTLRKRVLVRDWPAAAAQFGRWVNAGGKPLPGLVKRRAREAALFMGEAAKAA